MAAWDEYACELFDFSVADRAEFTGRAEAVLALHALDQIEFAAALVDVAREGE